jgi:type II restriction/modification system DNA methylase subunit YeeA
MLFRINSLNNISLIPDNWLENNLFDASYLANQLPNESNFNQDISELLEWLQKNYDANRFSKLTEAPLEVEFIQPLLEKLDWIAVYQQTLSYQGKSYRLDWSLLADEALKEKLANTASPEWLSVVCESKKYNQKLDTGKANEDNPHFQLVTYLNWFKVRFGFLTNGRYWRLYDANNRQREKTFLQIDLEAVLALTGDEQTHALRTFAYLFHKDRFSSLTQQNTAIEQVLQHSADFTLAVEENLKSVIYGTQGEESVFASIGFAIAARNPDASMTALYEHSMVLLFRLLFIMYFEDKNRNLLAAHPFYPLRGLQAVYDYLRDGAKAEQFDGYSNLNDLFLLLDKGNANIDIPLFNGGLFDQTRVPLLDTGKIFNNALLKTLLEKLLYKTSSGQALLDTRRDYKTMSVTHLGRIYEGLLEFNFEKAQENLFYIEYSEKGKNTIIDGYFDVYDKEGLIKSKAKINKQQAVKKGEIYFKNSSNSRKTTASYYTPSSLSEFLVKSGIDQALARGVKLNDIKILDNACGSGHFLVEALGYLTQKSIESLATDAVLRALLDDEKTKINEQLAFLNIDYAPDEAQILKRALLKRCIYGIDLNPFAVELARLSLWIDTFIFGTPLSFIEHHIVRGNALMGSSIETFNDFKSNGGTTGAFSSNRLTVMQDLFSENFDDDFAELTDIMQQLDSLKDTTAAEIAQSKRLYNSKIKPTITRLSKGLNFLVYCDLLRAQGKGKDVEKLLKDEMLFVVRKSQFADDQYHPVWDDIAQATKDYAFLHYELAFPEAKNGFDVIVGNPPWDKTKFTDLDFFPQYKSNYRSLNNSQKKTVQTDLLDKPHIKATYQQQERNAQVNNDYYKTNYPLNKGSGDGNLFRFFVEKNMSLLKVGGSLNYVLPSALLFEEGSQTLRKHILEVRQLTYFYSFENRDKLFPEVDDRYKFAMMQIVNQLPLTNHAVQSVFYLTQPSQLSEANRVFDYPVDILKKLSPDQWAMMELRNHSDLAILQRCYAAFQPLSEQWLDFRNELHLTADKDLFIEQYAQGLLPLYEGKMIWQYEPKFAPAQYWLNVQDFDARLTSKEFYRMAQHLSTESNKVKKADCEEKYADKISFDRQFYRLAFRDIASDTNERTLIFSLLPKNCGVGHTLNVSISKQYILQNEQIIIKTLSSWRLLFALAVFNSLVVDWIARFMIQIHASKTYLMRLPIPQPTDDEIQQNEDFKNLALNALKLTLANDWDGFSELATEFNIKKADLPQTDKAKDKLRIQNDVIVAGLYGLSSDDMRHILGGFKVLANKRPEYVAGLLEAFV